MKAIKCQCGKAVIEGIKHAHNFRTILEMNLSTFAREVYGENAVEFLVGALSSICTESQLNVLFESLKNKLKEAN